MAELQQAVSQVGAQILAHNVTGADGQVRPAITIQAGHTQYTLVLTIEEAEKLAAMLPDGLRGAAEYARKASAAAAAPDIIVPDTSTIQKTEKGRNRG